MKHEPPTLRYAVQRGERSPATPPVFPILRRVWISVAIAGVILGAIVIGTVLARNLRVAVGDELIEAAIRRDFHEFGFATCPHTATATHTWRQLDDALKIEHDWILVATAHPAKFDEIVEPLVSRQWFVSAEPLANLALEAV